MNKPDPSFEDSLQQAVRLHTAGEIDEAIIIYRALLEDHPDHPDLWHLMGVAAHQKDDNDLAISLITTAISLKEDVADYHSNLGMALRGLGRGPDAEASFRTAIELQPAHTKALSNLASTLRTAGEVAPALDYARRAVASNKQDAEALINLGNTEKDAGLLEDAIASYRHAVALTPDFALAHWNLSLALLSAGEYREGFDEMAWRWRWSGFPGRRRTFDQPEWTGDDLAGRTLLIYGEQGLGDTIHMLRFAQAVTRRGGRIILQLPEALCPLAGGRRLADEIIPESDDLPPFDTHAALLDLPRICALEGTDLFSHTPYLQVSSEIKTAWSNKVQAYDGLKVGLNWAGNPASPVEVFRCLPVDDLGPFQAVGGVTWFSLQKGGPPVVPSPDGLSLVETGEAPLEETAGLISALDLVITSDTAVAHLAGALGKPVWVLLHQAPDWKWGQEETTPWYPSAKLFRQSSPGDWAPVISNTAQALAQLATQKSGA